MELFSTLPPFLIAILNHTPQLLYRGEAGWDSVQFHFHCPKIAYHVELNAESNRSVEGLQLRLEEVVNFSWILKYYNRMNI